METMQTRGAESLVINQSTELDTSVIQPWRPGDFLESLFSSDHFEGQRCGCLMLVEDSMDPAATRETDMVTGKTSRQVSKHLFFLLCPPYIRDTISKMLLILGTNVLPSINPPWKKCLHGPDQRCWYQSPLSQQPRLTIAACNIQLWIFHTIGCS